MALGEIFSPDETAVMAYRPYLSKMSLGELIAADFMAGLDNYFDRLRLYCGIFYTFDVMFNQMDWLHFGWRGVEKPVYRYLHARGDIVISLVRDPREIFVSMKALDRIGQAHFIGIDCAEAAQQPSVGSVVLDRDEYLAFRDQLVADRALLARSFDGYDNYIELSYGDLLRDSDAALAPLDRALCRFGERIGRPFMTGISPFPDLVQSPVSYGRLFANLDEALSWPG